MRTFILLSLSMLLLSFPLKAKSQNIDNADFDSLCVCAIDRIWDWVTSDTYYLIGDTAQPFTPNQLYTSALLDMTMAWNTVQINYDNDPGHSMESVKLFNRPDLVYPDGEKFRGFIINGHHFYTDGNGIMDFRKGGSPFPYRPYSMNGMYKFEDSLSVIDEYGKAIVLLKKYNALTNSIDTIGYAESAMELNPSSVWSPFQLIIDYYNSAIPDSVVVIIESSTMGSGPTTLWIDDISFEYITEIDDYTEYPQISVFPNPCHNSIFASSSSDQNIFCGIANCQGVLIERVSAKNRIDMSSYPPGIYFIYMENISGKIEVHKIIKL